jgi:hypothetical protein
VVVLAGVQAIEIGDAVHPEQLSLAIDDELGLPDLPGGLHDPRIPAGPVVAALAEQPHPVADALNTKPVAVVFDLVEPVAAARDPFTRRLCLLGIISEWGKRPGPP